MIRKDQIAYLIDDVIFLSREFKPKFELDEQKIVLEYQGSRYEELVFNFNHPELSEKDFKLLDQIYHQACRSQQIESIPNMPILKLVHFFVNEFYLVPNLAHDKHGRVLSSQVDSRYMKYLEFPFVDMLMNQLFSQLKVLDSRPLEVYFTSDLDATNLWQRIGLKASIKRLLRNGLTLNLNTQIAEWKSFFLSSKNLKHNSILRDEMFCYDTYTGFDIKNIAFWHVYVNNPNFEGDRNWNEPSLLAYILKLKEQGVQFGIHPAYGTSDKTELLQKQVTIFKQLFGFFPSLNRYHYLKYDSPNDYQYLHELTIEKDFSFYFADSLLFRGSRTAPARLWDKNQNSPFKVVSYPMTIMDTTVSVYCKYDFETAKEVVLEKVDKVKRYGNTLVLLWHNTNMYKHFVKDNYHPELIKFIKLNLFSQE